MTKLDDYIDALKNNPDPNEEEQAIQDRVLRKLLMLRGVMKSSTKSISNYDTVLYRMWLSLI